MVVAAYIRVSTDEQADKGNSLSEQKERLAAYCTAMGWQEPIFFIDDGYSAKDMRRPAVQKLLSRVREFDIVLTSKLDRLSRNLLDLLQLVELLSQHDCNYVSASESFDTSNAVGRMTLQLLGTFAEFERERISERVKDNMLSLAKNTSRAITQACYGYDVVEGQFIINEHEAQYVRMMFGLAEQGQGHRMIALALNDRGVTTKRGKMWDQINVKRLMANETLVGKMIYNKRQTKNRKTTIRDKAEWVVKEDNHPAIIPLELFDQVKEIMRSRSHAKKHADSETYLLTGLLKCKHCGKNMRGNTSRQKTKNNEYTYYRYICSSYLSGYGCSHHAAHRDDLEQTIINEMIVIKSTSLRMLNLNVAPSASVADEIKELTAQLSRVDKRMQKQIEAYEKELITDGDLKAAKERIEVERERLREQLIKLESKVGDQETVKANIENLLPDIIGGDRVKSKAGIRKLIDSIEIENSELIGIMWKN